MKNEAAKLDKRVSEVIYDRVSDLMLKLLEGVERDIAGGFLPSPHLEAYDKLCRAETARYGTV